MTQTNLRFAPLIRVSTEKQKKKGESLNTQTAQIRAYVEALGGTVPSHCWKYSGQESATPDHERKLLDQLLTDSSRDLFDAVIVVDPSRWSRDNMKNEKGLQILRDNGIRFFVGASEFDLFDPTQNFFLSVSAVIGEYTINLGAVKSIQNRIARAKQNTPTAGKIPYGRVYDKQTGRWSVDPEKQRIIQGAAQRYIAGENIKDIANSVGQVRTTLLANMTEKAGEEWPVRFRYEKARIDETVIYKIPAILPPEIIKKVQDRIALNTNTRKGAHGWKFLLTGFVFCTKCGFRMNQYQNQSSTPLRYYRHRTNQQNKDCKAATVKGQSKNVLADLLEEKVLLHLIRTFGDPEKIQRAVERATPKVEKIDGLMVEQADLKEKLNKLKRSKSLILDEVEEGTFSREDVKARMNRLRERSEAIVGRLEAIRIQLESLPDPVKIRKVSEMASAVLRNVSHDNQRVYRDNPDEVILRRDYEWEKRLVEQAFMGADPHGRSLGIYMEYVRGEWLYRIRGLLGGVVGSLTREDETHYSISQSVSSGQLEHHQRGG